MALTPAQNTTLKNDVIAKSASGQPLEALVAAGNWDGVAGYYNALAVPAWIVWRSDVTIDEIMRNGMDWARVDNLTVGKARIWEWLGRLGVFNASKANIRAGIDAAWVGSAPDLAVRALIYTHCKRSARVLGKLLSTGVGTDASPATLDYEGTVSAQQLSDLMTVV